MLYTKTIHQRIEELIDTYCEGNVALFAQKLGISPSSVHDMIGTGRRKSKPSFDTLVKILETFLDINAEWLLLGGAEMHTFRNDWHPNGLTYEEFLAIFHKTPEYRIMLDKMVVAATAEIAKKLKGSNDN